MVGQEGRLKRFRQRIKIDGIYTYFDPVVPKRKKKVKINLLKTLLLNCGFCNETIIKYYKYKLPSSKPVLCEQCKSDKKIVKYFNHKLISAQRWTKSKQYNLTIEDFWKIKTSDCRYCGEIGSGEKPNGIDRLNNEIGYIVENCVPCCYSCNIMKNVFAETDFLKHIKKIYNHNFTI